MKKMSQIPETLIFFMGSFTLPYTCKNAIVPPFSVA